jgi:hypothetical protein
MDLRRDGRRIQRFVTREIAGNRRDFVQFACGGEDSDLVEIGFCANAASI